MSAKDLKDKLKALRMAHSGKAIGKMSAEEIAAEIDHHETAAKARDMKAKRLAALAAAREAKKATKEVAEIPKKEFVKEHKKLVAVLEKGSKKEQKKEAKEQKKELKKVKYVPDTDSDMSSTDSDTDTETIKKRIQKKKTMKDE